MKSNLSRPNAARHLRLACAILVGSGMLSWVPLQARPTEVDDTDTLGKGLTEIESGIEFERAMRGKETVITPAATYGLTDRFEVELGLDYVFSSPDGEAASETWKPAAKFKTKLWRSDSGGLSLAFKGKLALPVTTHGPKGSEAPEGYARLLGTRLAGPWEYDVNLGYKYRGAWDSGGNDKYTAGTSVRYKVSSKWQLLSELVGELPDKPGGRAIALVDAAVKYTVRDGLKVDFLIGTGIGRDALELRVVSGVKWEF